MLSANYFPPIANLIGLGPGPGSGGLADEK